MKTVSILAQKGGAGKTTLALHWAVEAERQGVGRVAVIDMDPQGSAISWSLRRAAPTPAMLRADAGNIREALTACEAEGMALVFIDTMPRIEAPCVEAARVAHLGILPCGPSVVDIEAIGATVAILRRVHTPGGIVLNQGRPGSPVNAKAASVLAQYRVPMCPVHVMRRAALADAFTDGRAVVEIEPHGKAADEIRRSWAWIAQQLQGAS